MDARRTIGRAVSILDHSAAALSRLEHGPHRSDVANVRAKLTEASADLLVLRAHLAPAEAEDRPESM